MDFIIDAIVEWLKGLLVDGIMGNLDGLFDNVNQSVGEIATQVGTTPADWNAGVFSMIRQISETAILPIAGVILTFVMTYELIQMLIERNNLHEVDTWMFFKWVFKTFVAVMILTNTFNIVLAVFDVSQHVIQQSAGIIQNGTEITPDVLDSLRTELEAMELGPLFGLWLQSFLIQLTMIALNIVIFVIVYGGQIAAETACRETVSSPNMPCAEESLLPELSPDAQMQMNRILLNALGVVRDAQTLEAGIQEIRKLSGTLPLLGCAMLESALARKESRGAHWRADYPQRNDAVYCKTTVAHWNGQHIAISFESIPERRHDL